MSILLKNGLVVDYKNNIFKRLDILIENEIIKDIAENIDSEKVDNVIDCIGLTIVPGLVDLYCMLDDERKIDVSRSSLYSATMGGYTTLCVHGKYKTYEKNVCNIIDLDEFEKRNINNKYVFEISNNKGINEGDIAKQIDITEVNSQEEALIISKELDEAEKNNIKLFINKITTKTSVELVRNAKSRGVKVLCSTCPHYYSFTVNNILESGVNSKTNPPLRTEEDRIAIIEGIADGTIDCIVTDNTPISEDAKSIGIGLAPTGVIGFETALSSALTVLLDSGKITYKDLVKLFCYNPSKILGIDGGVIEIGKLANIVVFDPLREFTFSKERIISSSKNTPWINKRLRGHVRYTIYSGEIVYQRNKSLIK